MNWLRIFFEAGLMQPGRMMLPCTQGRHVESANGWPVRGSFGFFKVTLREVKFPLR